MITKEINHKITKEGLEILKNTFSLESGNLPSVSFLKTHIQTDDWNAVSYIDGFEKIDSTFRLRAEYVKYNFSILSHEFIVAIGNMIKSLRIDTISELSCGTGWFTYWLKRYKIPIIDCVDNMSWKPHSEKYLKLVKKYDSVKYTKENLETQLFILSWNYMDETAYRIWEAMKPGQYLLHIGEGYGGCTSSDKFFNSVKRCAVEDKWKLEKYFISFYGIHDFPALYLKK